eukprot:TRINITY_DN54314_c0_g1_i1.p1 TRINITY_DN54314_c0_g1~~TRINITY_DN54314_c0_g1_i1.p1  ORF type:complete len:497 (+),score=4.49 TRINITY_DN54314_c0_g1_i1:51-1541(+)
MNKLYLCLFIFCLLIINIYGHIDDDYDLGPLDSEPENGEKPLDTAPIVDLDAKLFNEMLYNSKLVLVLFYASHDPTSSGFLPAYQEIANHVNDFGDLVIGRVDCTEEEALYQQEDIIHYPTLKIYVQGEPIVYDGDLMDINAVIDFLFRLTESALMDIDETPNGFREFMKELSPTEPVALYIMNPNIISHEQDDLIFSFDYACKKFYTIPCGITANTTIFGDKISNYPAILMIRDFPNEDPIEVADSSVKTIGNVLTWMQLAAFPKFTEFTEKNEASIYNLKRLGFSTHIITIVDTNLKIHHKGRDITPVEYIDANNTNVENHGLNLLNGAHKLATKYRGEAVFSYVDMATSTSYTHTFLERLDVEPDHDLPMVLVANAVQSHINFYAFKSNEITPDAPEGTISIVTPESMENFLERYFKNELHPTSRRKHDLPDEISSNIHENESNNLEKEKYKSLTVDMGKDIDEEDNDFFNEEAVEDEDIYQDALFQHLMNLK